MSRFLKVDGQTFEGLAGVYTAGTARHHVTVFRTSAGWTAQERKTDRRGKYTEGKEIHIIKAATGRTMAEAVRNLKEV